ncbi:hypothetical protein AB0I16_21035 [Streptomyces sp. NPDC050703]|uniref:hypothetical protein n=1 Tax=Streptomyces sp. NPDC050703 TaxID=3157218 RepID=UPI00341C6B9E
MRMTQIGVRAGLVVAAAALPSALGTTAAVAAGGLAVTVTGSPVHVTTAACPDGGTASSRDRCRAIRAGAGQAEPIRGSGSRLDVVDGTRAVPVAGEDGTWAEPPGVPAGGGATPTSMPTTSSTTMPTSMPTATSVPTASPTTAPARGVRGGVGGGSEDRGTLALAAGGALVAAAAGAGLWHLRRRGAHGRT